ncbi:MAG: ankyrin repeat domain-containing protein [Myxococcota bacterium]
MVAIGKESARLRREDGMKKVEKQRRFLPPCGLALLSMVFGCGGNSGTDKTTNENRAADSQSVSSSSPLSGQGSSSPASISSTTGSSGGSSGSSSSTSSTRSSSGSSGSDPSNSGYAAPSPAQAANAAPGHAAGGGGGAFVPPAPPPPSPFARLMTAVRGGNHAAMRTLLLEDPSLAGRYEGVAGNTPIQVAADQGDIAAAAILLEQDQGVTLADATVGGPLLFKAVEEADAAKTELFLANHAAVRSQHLQNAVENPCSLEVLNLLLADAGQAAVFMWEQEGVRAASRCIVSQPVTCHHAKEAVKLLLNDRDHLSEKLDTAGWVNLATWLVDAGDTDSVQRMFQQPPERRFSLPPELVYQVLAHARDLDQNASQDQNAEQTAEALVSSLLQTQDFWSEMLIHAIRGNRPWVVQKAVAFVNRSDQLRDTLRTAYPSHNGIGNNAQQVSGDTKQALLDGIVAKSLKEVVSPVVASFQHSDAAAKEALRQRLWQKIENDIANLGEDDEDAKESDDSYIRRDDTPLHAAARLGEESLFTLLFSGSDQQKQTIANVINSERQTPLHVAAQAGFAKAVEQLADVGANLTATDNGGKRADQLAVAARQRADGWEQYNACTSVVRALLLRADPNGDFAQGVRRRDYNHEDTLWIMKEIMNRNDLSNDRVCAWVDEGLVKHLLRTNGFRSGWPSHPLVWVADTCFEQADIILKTTASFLQPPRPEVARQVSKKIALRFGYGHAAVTTAWTKAVEVGNQNVVQGLLGGLNTEDERKRFFDQFKREARRKQLLLATRPGSKNMPQVARLLIKYDPPSVRFTVRVSEDCAYPFLHRLVKGGKAFAPMLDLALSNVTDEKEREDLANMVNASSGQTMLHVAAEEAAENGHAAIPVLMRHGADPFQKNRIGKSPVAWALKGKNQAVVGQLLVALARRNDFEGLSDLVGRMIDEGTEPRCWQDSVQTLADWALEHDRADVVPSLMRAADLGQIKNVIEKAVEDEGEKVALALLNSVKDQGETLFPNDDPDYPHERWYAWLDKLLLSAVESRQLRIVTWLLEQQADPSTTFRGTRECCCHTSLHKAAEKSRRETDERILARLEILRLLAQHTRDIDKPGTVSAERKGYTPLQLLVDGWFFSTTTAPAPAATDEKENARPVVLQKAYQETALALLRRGATPDLGPCWDDNKNHLERTGSWSEENSTEKQQKLTRLRDWIQDEADALIQGVARNQILPRWGAEERVIPRDSHKDVINLMSSYCSDTRCDPEEEEMD